jgi:hypothetical protein
MASDTNTSSVAQFDEAELVIISNALNEVCNGLDIWEFEIRIGVPRDEVLVLLAKVQDQIDNLGKE